MTYVFGYFATGAGFVLDVTDRQLGTIAVLTVVSSGLKNILSDKRDQMKNCFSLKYICQLSINRNGITHTRTHPTERQTDREFNV